jgi:hypothetical protein
LSVDPTVVPATPQALSPSDGAEELERNLLALRYGLGIFPNSASSIILGTQQQQQQQQQQSELHELLLRNDMEYIALRQNMPIRRNPLNPRGYRF